MYEPPTPIPIDAGALLGRTYPLPDGTRVRLRMLHASDLPALRELFAERGVLAGDVALARLVRHDPRSRVVICAAAQLGGGEQLVGVVAGELDGEAELDTLVVDESFVEGLPGLLVGALQDRVVRHRRRVA